MKLFFLSMLFFFNLAIAQESTSGYSDELIDLVEAIYGKGLLSQGGTKSVNDMFNGIDLNGKKVLDIGSGLGGPDVYLANKYNVDIVGVDANPLLILRSKQYLAEHKDKLKGTISFVLLKNPYDLKQFPDQSFDIVFSRETILHIPKDKKLDYIKEMFRVLKSGGRFVILDWLHTSPDYSPQLKKMMDMDGISFALISSDQYLSLLKEVGFNAIKFTDLTNKHAIYTQKDIDMIKNLENIIKEKFGEDTYNYSVESWTIQKKAFDSKELRVALFTATKS